MLEGLSGTARRPKPAPVANLLGGLRAENAIVPMVKGVTQSVPNYPPSQQIDPEDMGDYGGKMRVNDTGILGFGAEASPPPPVVPAGESPMLFTTPQEPPPQFRQSLPQLLIEAYRRKYPMR
jgi:hypothetical protein